SDVCSSDLAQPDADRGVPPGEPAQGVSQPLLRGAEHASGVRRADGAHLGDMRGRADDGRPGSGARVSALERSYAAAERVTADWAKSFYFASRFLPLPKKRAIFALYDFCRHADNLVDDRGDRPIAEVRAEIEALDAEVRAIHAGRTP